MILPLRLVNNKTKEEGIKRLPLAEQGKFFFAVHGVEAVGAKVGYAVVFSFGLQQRFNALQDGVVEAFFVGVGVDDGGCHRTPGLVGFQFRAESSADFLGERRCAVILYGFQATWKAGGFYSLRKMR